MISCTRSKHCPSLYLKKAAKNIKEATPVPRKGLMSGTGLATHDPQTKSGLGEVLSFEMVGGWGA
jgi:hypothetical protein